MCLDPFIIGKGHLDYYACNSYKEVNDPNKSKTAINLQKFTFYSERYIIQKYSVE